MNKEINTQNIILFVRICLRKCTFVPPSKRRKLDKEDCQFINELKCLFE